MPRKGVFFLLPFILLLLESPPEALSARSGYFAYRKGEGSFPGLLDGEKPSKFLFFQKEFLRPSEEGKALDQGERAEDLPNNEPVFAVDYDLILRYLVINPGPLPVSGVRVEDSDFAKGNPFLIKVPEDAVWVNSSIKESGMTFDLGMVGAREKVTVEFELRPWKEEMALVRLHPAKMWFKALENGDYEEEERVGFSSLSHERIRIMSKMAADRKHRSKTVEFLLTVWLFLLPVMVPFMMWRKSVKKYESLVDEWKDTKAQKRKAKKIAGRRKRSNLREVYLE